MDTYRLLAGLHVDTSGKRHTNNCIVASSLSLDKLFPGQFLKLDSETAPEPALAKDKKASGSKAYDVTPKFKTAIAVGLTVAKKGKLYFISPLRDVKSTVINKSDLDSPQAVNDYIANYSN